MTILIENAIPDPSLNIAELTEASLDGDGVLDTLLRTMRLHLDREFKENRITGTAYATVYAQSLTTFLQQSIQYSLAKSKQALELDGLRAQNELLKTQKDQMLAETNKIATDTVVSIKQGHLVEAQTCEVKARTNQINADVGIRFPVEVDNLKKQGVLISAQTDEVSYRVTDVMPAEVQRTNTESEQVNYRTHNILPVERNKLLAEVDLVVSQDDLLEFDLLNKQPLETEILEKQRDQLIAQIDGTKQSTNKVAADTLQSMRQTKLIEANTCNTEAQTVRITAETTLKLPEEVSILKKQILQSAAQTDLIVAQAEKTAKEVELAVSQLELAEKELVLKDKSIDLLIAQVETQEAQSDLYAQKAITEKGQTNSSVIGTNSVMARQNEMMKAQADGFKRDAEQKAAKIMIDTWNLRKNTDPDATEITATNQLLDANIGKSVEVLLEGVGITV